MVLVMTGPDPVGGLAGALLFAGWIRRLPLSCYCAK